jgi:hypothetical protein
MVHSRASAYDPEVVKAQRTEIPSWLFKGRSRSVIQRIQLVTRLYLVWYETDSNTQFHPKETDISYNE